MQFGHIGEIHSVPGGHHHERRRHDCDEREQLDDLAGLIRGHVQIHLQDAGERVVVVLR